MLFSGTIADNISYGLDPTLSKETRILLSPDSTPEEKATAKLALKDRIIDAAKMANAHEFISKFPQGYDTDVGSSGSSMSGGQKQRIAIARALIKKPAVLLLDEATSALDASSERLVQQSIDMLQASKMQTTIVIAHRLSTIRGADKIAVVSQGVIAELGTHDDLVLKNGIYADLIRLQMTDLAEAPAAEEGEADEETKDGETRPTMSLEPLSPTDPGTPHAVNTDKPTTSTTDTKVEAELSKEEKKVISQRIWAMIYHLWHWLAVAFVGALFFGAV